MLENREIFASCALGYTISLLKGKWGTLHCVGGTLDMMPDKRAGYSALLKAIPTISRTR